METQLRERMRPQSASALQTLLTANAYITDGTDLFRCTARQGEAMVELENCLTLDIVAIPLSELRPGRVRLVKLGDAPLAAASGIGLLPESAM